MQIINAKRGRPVRFSHRMFLIDKIFRLCLPVGLVLLLLPGCNEFAQEPPARYRYQPPDPDNKDWPVSSLEAENIDVLPVADLTNLIRTEKYRNIHSLLIVRNGKLVYEQYFNGFTPDIPENIYSASKSITSALIGIAIDKGMIKSVDEKVLTYFPQYASDRAIAEQKQAITIRHLLTMSSGLACNDWAGAASPGFEENMVKTDDWIKFTLELPQQNEPGSSARYCTAGVVTLGGVLSRASGMPVEEFARQYLFEPLAIERYRWSRMPDGQVNTGGKLFIRPRDMAKIGQLFLNSGSWGGQQLLSREWVAASTQKQVTLEGFDYGYLWWRRNFMVNNEAVETYFGWGNGGNYICVVPQYQVVIVSTAGNLNSALTNQFFQMLQTRLLPALL